MGLTGYVRVHLLTFERRGQEERLVQSIARGAPRGLRPLAPPRPPPPIVGTGLGSIRVTDTCDGVMQKNLRFFHIFTIFFSIHDVFIDPFFRLVEWWWWRLRACNLQWLLICVAFGTVVVLWQPFVGGD